jgi:hypothetical protein
MTPIARMFIIFGLLFLVIGGLIYVFGRVGIPVGRLPGDIKIKGENFTCFIPLATSILLSIILTVILNVIVRFKQIEYGKFIRKPGNQEIFLVSWLPDKYNTKHSANYENLRLRLRPAARIYRPDACRAARFGEVIGSGSLDG